MTVFVALSLGFKVAMLIGSACYLIAAIAAPALEAASRGVPGDGAGWQPRRREPAELA